MNFCAMELELLMQYFFLSTNLVRDPRSGQYLGQALGGRPIPLTYDMFRGDGLALSPHSVYSIRKVDWGFLWRGRWILKLCVSGLQHGKHSDRYKVFKGARLGRFTLHWVPNSGRHTLHQVPNSGITLDCVPLGRSTHSAVL